MKLNSFDKVKQLTEEMVAIPSINKEPGGESAVARYMQDFYMSLPYFQAHPEQVKCFQTKNDFVVRHSTLAYVKGTKGNSNRTVILIGHIDTVGVDDFGTIREYAFRCEELPAKLRETFVLPQEVIDDIESGEYLFGRGALDMKSGVAGHMYLIQYFSEHPEELDGNLLAIGECDEEDNSKGIITALDLLEELKEKEHFEYVACINADYSTNYAPGDDVTGVPTGFKDLDTYLSGLQPSDFILVAARPSMGKTAFVLNVAENVAIKQQITTVVFSLEMSNVQLVNRMLSLESTVDADKIRKGHLDSNDWGKLIEGADSIAKSKLIIDDTPGISIAELRSKCRKYKMENNLGLIIIDYLQLMSGSGSGRSEGRQQEVSDISRALKALARELNVPVVTLSQLSRAVEQRPDHRPMLSDLRESGAIEQDADVVMFLYRDDYYNKDTEQKGIAEIIIAKQRNGPIGTVKMAWLPEQTRFADLSRDLRQ